MEFLSDLFTFIIAVSLLVLNIFLIIKFIALTNYVKQMKDTLSKQFDDKSVEELITQSSTHEYLDEIPQAIRCLKLAILGLNQRHREEKFRIAKAEPIEIKIQELKSKLQQNK